jgi:restriction system protein
MYEVEIRHDGLHKYRLIKGNDPHVVEQKAHAQLAQWDEQWQRKQQVERQRQERQDNKSWAEAKTADAQAAIARIEQVLSHALTVNSAVDWTLLKDNSPFPQPVPQEPPEPSLRPRPQATDSKYVPRLGILDRIIGLLKRRKLERADRWYRYDCASWESEKQRLAREYAEAKAAYARDIKRWKTECTQFLEKQRVANVAVDNLCNAYAAGTPSAIVEYFDLVLSRSQYPDTFPQQFQLDYNPDTTVLVVDYSLPSPDQIPTVKEVRYVQSRAEFVNVPLTEAEKAALYDSLLYRIALRTLHELYEADMVKAASSVVFNGWVRSIDRTTGNEANACILSVQANKDEFMTINLREVDPKACFKKLKGIGSAALHSLTPVAPLISISREDKRFVAAHEVVDKINEGYNLAAMDWEDFEHLVRELFEREFSQGGGEVKITRASRDGGVDAVAFDPDPIRGGKIVIQAKRYTATVGVSAVRDLYGTVVNEGATKGILVTTADYGPDAYDFARGKPLTLLNGGNLLHLLQKHGYKATIDLKEARRILLEREKEQR